MIIIVKSDSNCRNSRKCQNDGSPKPMEKGRHCCASSFLLIFLLLALAAKKEPCVTLMDYSSGGSCKRQKQDAIRRQTWRRRRRQSAPRLIASIQRLVIRFFFSISFLQIIKKKIKFYVEILFKFLKIIIDI